MQLTEPAAYAAAASACPVEAAPKNLENIRSITAFIGELLGRRADRQDDEFEIMRNYCAQRRDQAALEKIIAHSTF
ncbi:hypothetical protein ABLE91_24265 [Aquabacter sp. CN5-332]|uniref:hypothetical protein n=1 Tax=Aquabacter sp. CN5-332 TaxID=3156608 RepID=UPI0032B33E79